MSSGLLSVCHAAVCMPHLTNDSLSIPITLLWDRNLSFSCFILKRRGLRSLFPHNVYQCNNTQEIQFIICLCKLYSTCVKDVCAYADAQWRHKFLYALLVDSNKWMNVCLCCIILSWQISTTGQTTDLTDTALAKWAKWASWTHCIRLGALQHLVALSRTDRARRMLDLRLGPWILIGSFGLTSVCEHCWHTQSFPLNVTLSPMGKGLLWLSGRELE